MKAMYFHQANQLGERTVADLCNTLKIGKVQAARIKCTQWLTWTGKWDAGPAWDINSLDDIRRLRDEFAKYDIKLQPWGVPMGLQMNGVGFAYNLATVAAEAQRFADIANICEFIDCDVEPYGEFNPPIVANDYRWVSPFFEYLRDKAPDARIEADFPYRDNSWPGDENDKMTPFIELASPYVDAFSLQSYFGIPQAQDAEARARAHTNKEVYHIGHTTKGGPVSLDQMAAWCDGNGDENFAVWVGQLMSLQDYRDLAKYDFSEVAPPQPTDLQWQEPGFAELYRAGTITGVPIDLAVSDASGNVHQEGEAGWAHWSQRRNQNYWQEY
jgi:hypothetical protein